VKPGNILGFWCDYASAGAVGEVLRKRICTGKWEELWRENESGDPSLVSVSDVRECGRVCVCECACVGA